MVQIFWIVSINFRDMFKYSDVYYRGMANISFFYNVFNRYNINSFIISIKTCKDNLANSLVYYINYSDLFNTQVFIAYPKQNKKMNITSSSFCFVFIIFYKSDVVLHQQ